MLKVNLNNTWRACDDAGPGKLPEVTLPCVTGCLLDPAIALGTSDTLVKECVWFEASLWEGMVKAADAEERLCFRPRPSGLLAAAKPVSNKGSGELFGMISGLDWTTMGI